VPTRADGAKERDTDSEWCDRSRLGEGGKLAEPLARLVVAEAEAPRRGRLRVVLIGPFGIERDGIARYSSGLASELERQECDVKVVAPRRLSGPDTTNHLGDLVGDRQDFQRLQGGSQTGRQTSSTCSSPLPPSQHSCPRCSDCSPSSQAGSS
jgi:hypothetical protein